MKFQRTPTSLIVQLEGPIGETTPLFNLPMAGLKEITLDMDKTTTINSIGIKQWIFWTLKIPKDCEVRMVNCPFIIGNQASNVVGFAKPNMKLHSLRLPFVCSECDNESMYEVKMGVDYEYGTSSSRPVLKLPDKIKCLKCAKDTAEPDFLTEKTFKFLEAPKPS